MIDRTFRQTPSTFDLSSCLPPFQVHLYKIIPTEEDKKKDQKETVKKEVEMIANLCHTHIVEFVHLQGWKMGKPVQIFMSVAKGSLRDYPSTKMGKNEVVLLSRHIIAALQYLHKKRIVHGDIKSENILYENRTMGLTFFLADFGYVMRIGSEIPCVETQIYFAPEVWFGAQHDFGRDIWSLGVVIYEISRKINVTRTCGLTDRILTPEDWCSRPECACRNTDDLAKMVTFDDQRATAKDLYASSSFLDLPDDLPNIFDLPKT